MSIYSDLELREVPMFLPRRKQEWENLLRSRGLRTSEAIVTAGLYDTEDNLRGCASLCKCGKGFSIQCVAMDESIDEHGQVARLIDFLRNKAGEEYINNAADCNIFLFTKPEYGAIFSSLAFHPVGKAPEAILLESNRESLNSYKRYLTQQRRPGSNGIIVMNANPFTKGHAYLVSTAAAIVDNLYIIPVGDDGDEATGNIPFRLRKHAIEMAVSHIPNVTVLAPSRYAISAATFPNYFLKELSDVSLNQIALDLDIFIRHIAPSLGITVRFVGTEQEDKLTAQYNARLKALLPPEGIDVLEIERFAVSSQDQQPVSATSVRRCLAENNWRQVRELVPDTTLAMLLAETALSAMRAELDLSPKPGLVTPLSAGAHSDMDYALMSSVIESLRPNFEKFAMLGLNASPFEDIIAAGVAAEQTMMQTSGGINTHRGAIFSLGLMIAAAGQILGSGLDIKADNLSQNIAKMALCIRPAEDTNGTTVRDRLHLRSALDMARDGYRELFDSWLPFFRHRKNDEHNALMTLLLIMSTLDDTNICHRGGLEALNYVKNAASALTENFTITGVHGLDAHMTTIHLSPGGSADMLALTLLAHSLIS